MGPSGSVTRGASCSGPNDWRMGPALPRRVGEGGSVAAVNRVLAGDQDPRKPNPLPPGRVWSGW